jgi:hypothetical protein
LVTSEELTTLKLEDLSTEVQEQILGLLEEIKKAVPCTMCGWYWKGKSNQVFIFRVI